MGCTVDHLRRDARVRVLREFTDARGVKHHVGETAVIRELELDWPKQELWFEWERGGKTERVTFGLGAKEGPRNGHMKEFFAVEGEAPRPRPVPPPPPQPPRLPVPPLKPKGSSTEGSHAYGVERLRALISQHRFEEANEAVGVLLAGHDPHGYLILKVAGDLENIAAEYAGDSVADAWARDRAVGLWYAWGSSATSGGEGAARSWEIDRAVERLRGR
jgi:hypothetical protein